MKISMCLIASCSAYHSSDYNEYTITAQISANCSADYSAKYSAGYSADCSAYFTPLRNNLQPSKKLI